MTDDDAGLRPIPASVEAVDELDGVADGGALLEELQARAERVRDLVPDCVGVSLGSLQHGVTLALAASDREVALFDGVQYVDGGPCVEGVVADQVVSFTVDQALDEHDWRLFAETTAASGVRSTLTLPIVVRGSVVGSVNLYAASTSAFDGLHAELADIFGAWAAGAVTNADLSFSTRQEAQRAPERLHDQLTVEVAVGIVAARRGVTTTQAEEQLRRAAAQAGVSLVELARTIKQSVPPGREDTDGGPGAAAPPTS